MSKLNAVLKKIYIWLYTLTYYISAVPLKFFDIRHGTEFGGIDFKGDRGGRFAYYPSSVFTFPLLRRYIKRHMNGGKGHSVLDIGCGKGLILYFFSSLDFDLVSGIEYNGKLCRIAKRNLRKVSRPAKVYQADAVDFTMYENYDTFYLYNPFDEAIVEKCTDRIMSSLERRPRKLTVIYCNPVCGDSLKRKGFKEEGHFYYKTSIFVFHGEK
ncbi:MAG: class I SAM-dependent methyltransferase [Eubacterium sp.]|nr:class I SAM-dependent methyltransferase [Eubacterium sp.]